MIIFQDNDYRRLFTVVEGLPNITDDNSRPTSDDR